jgi:hypothetical protein
MCHIPAPPPQELSSLVCEAGRGLALGHPAQQHHEGGRSLSSFREDSTRQQGMYSSVIRICLSEVDILVFTYLSSS